MTDAQFWGLLVSIIALGLAMLKMMHGQNQRIDATAKAQEKASKDSAERIEEVNRSMHYATAELREEINQRDGKIHTRLTQHQIEAEKRYATKDGTEKALDRISAEIKSVGRDLKSEIEKLRDQDRGGQQ